MGTQEKHHADGISSQQILALFSCRNPLIWSEKCVVSNLRSPRSQRSFDNASHLVNQIAFAYSEAGLQASEAFTVCREANVLRVRGQFLARSIFISKGEIRLHGYPGSVSQKKNMLLGPLVLGAWLTGLGFLFFLTAMRNLLDNPGKGCEHQHSGAGWPLSSAGSFPFPRDLNLKEMLGQMMEPLHLPKPLYGEC